MQDREASEGAMTTLWSGGVNVEAMTRYRPPIRSCLGMKVSGLVI